MNCIVWSSNRIHTANYDMVWDFYTFDYVYLTSNKYTISQNLDSLVVLILCPCLLWLWVTWLWLFQQMTTNMFKELQYGKCVIFFRLNHSLDPHLVTRSPIPRHPSIITNCLWQHIRFCYRKCHVTKHCPSHIT